MSDILEKNFETLLFSIKTYPCDCVQDTIHRTPGAEPEITFKAQAISSSPYIFSYVAKEGLCKTGPNGAILERNILGKMLGLATAPTSAYRDFFARYGFLFPVSDEDYDSLDIGVVQGLLLRLKAAVDLKAEIESVRKDYKRMAQLIRYLLSEEQITIQTSKMQNTYQTARHPFLQVVQSPPILTREREKEALKHTYAIDDPIVAGYELPIETYQQIESEEFYPHPLLRGCTLMLVNRSIQDDSQYIACYLHHLIMDTNQGGHPFSEAMKLATIKVAKMILAYEINENIRSIQMTVNADSLRPTWSIDSLYAAAYFSLFYTSDSMEIMRQCQNPNCKNYFLVRATTTTKKYCCEECRNRVMQSRYRKRKRETCEK